MILPFSPIRVFLVDDSPLALTLLKRMLATSPDIDLVGTARNGRDALAMFPETRPKVICTDYQMPVMDGLQLVQEIMVSYPRPILVISSLITAEDHAQALPLLAAGAVDVFPKPSAATPFDETADKLVRKIKLLAGVFVISRKPSEQVVPRPAIKPVAERSSAALSRPKPVTIATNVPPRAAHLKQVRLVCIGASTGGPQTLQNILSGLPSNFPQPILCVQHISTGFLKGLVDWLNNSSRLKVKIAENGERAQAGTIYFPPENHHLEISPAGQLRTTSGPPIDGHKPSVTATFQSAARSYGSAALTILLTGMGGDGALGMHAVATAGGLTIAQDEASCVVYGMPRQAVELGAAQFVLPPDEIRQTLLQMLT